MVAWGTLQAPLEIISMAAMGNDLLIGTMLNNVFRVSPGGTLSYLGNSIYGLPLYDIYAENNYLATRTVFNNMAVSYDKGNSWMNIGSNDFAQEPLLITIENDTLYYVGYYCSRWNKVMQKWESIVTNQFNTATAAILTPYGIFIARQSSFPGVYAPLILMAKKSGGSTQTFYQFDDNDFSFDDVTSLYYANDTLYASMSNGHLVTLDAKWGGPPLQDVYMPPLKKIITNGSYLFALPVDTGLGILRIPFSLTGNMKVSSIIPEKNFKNLFFDKGVLYAVTETGKIYTTQASNGTGWKPISMNGFPQDTLYNIAVSGGEVFACTFSSGVWHNTVSNILAVPGVAPSTQTAVYPNPFTSELYIAESADLTLSLYDVMGKLCNRQKISKDKTADVRELAPGIYIYSLQYEDGRMANGKLVKAGN